MASRGIELILDNCPTKAASLTNNVYLHPDTLRLIRTKKVKLSIGNYFVIHTVVADSNTSPDKLGANALARNALGLTEQDVNRTKICIEAYEPKDVAQLFQLEILVDIFGRKQQTVDGRKVEDCILETLAGRETFCKRQMFMMQMESIYLKLTVQSLTIPDAKAIKTPFHGDGVKNALFGDIGPKTQITLVPSNNRKMLWKAPKKRLNIGPNFDGEQLGIGGLDRQFADIFRRAFASRLIPTAQLQKMGLNHVKGMLLYGPPGTGKTLIARKIGQMLTERPPKVVNGPEILNKFVGASEENIRKLFQDARDDQDENGDEADLHIIIFDEIDAICKARGSVGGGTGVHDTVVNQLLSMIDGVDCLNNILVIGMTNRKDLIDNALLRPGRLEVKLEIGLPDMKGREQIFRIHTKKLRDEGFLAPDVDITRLAAVTKNYSGAEIEGVVKSACSFSYFSLVDSKEIKNLPREIAKMKVKLADFDQALEEIKPEFGVQEDELTNRLAGGFHVYGDEFKEMMAVGQQLLKQVRNPKKKTRRLSMLLHGPRGCGKTAIAARLALEADFPFVKLISPDSMVGNAEQSKCLKINQVFEDAYKSNASVIIIDDLERLLGYVEMGPRFSAMVLSAIKILCRKEPSETGRSICIIATSGSPRMLQDLGLDQCFDRTISVPLVSSPNDVKDVMKGMKCNVEGTDLELISMMMNRKRIGIKNLQLIIESAQDDNDRITYDSFKDACRLYGFGDKKNENADDY